MENSTKKPMIYLIQPKKQFNQHLVNIRGQLQRWKIPFQQQNGYQLFEELKHNNKYHYIIIINNGNITQDNIPNTIKNEANKQIYTYPKKHPRYPVLKNGLQLINMYQQLNNNVPKQRSQSKIKVKSLRKQTANNSDRNNAYTNVVIYFTDGYSNEFARLVDVMESQPQVMQLKGIPNQISRIVASVAKNNKKKILMITQIQNLHDFFVGDHRLSKQIDIAVFGLKSDAKLKQDNVVIATTQVRDILQFVQQNGVQLNYAIPLYINSERNIGSRNLLLSNRNSQTSLNRYLDNEKTPIKGNRQNNINLQGSNISSSAQTKKNVRNQSFENELSSEQQTLAENNQSPDNIKLNIVNKRQNDGQLLNKDRFMPQYTILQLSQENKQSYVASQLQRINRSYHPENEDVEIKKKSQHSQFRIAEDQQNMLYSKNQNALKRAKSYDISNKHRLSGDTQQFNTSEQNPVNSFSYKQNTKNQVYNKKSVDPQIISKPNLSDKVINAQQYMDCDYRIVTIQQLSVPSSIEDIQPKTYKNEILQKMEQKNKKPIKFSLGKASHQIQQNNKKYVMSEHNKRNERYNDQNTQKYTYAKYPQQQQNITTYRHHNKVQPAEHISVSNDKISTPIFYDNMRNNRQDYVSPSSRQTHQNTSHYPYRADETSSGNHIKIYTHDIDLTKYDRSVDERGKVVYRPKYISKQHVQNSHDFRNVRQENTNYVNSDKSINNRNLNQYNRPMRQPENQPTHKVQQKLVVSQYYKNGNKYHSPNSYNHRVMNPSPIKQNSMYTYPYASHVNNTNINQRTPRILEQRKVTTASYTHQTNPSYNSHYVTPKVYTQEQYQKKLASQKQSLSKHQVSSKKGQQMIHIPTITKHTAIDFYKQSDKPFVAPISVYKQENGQQLMHQNIRGTQQIKDVISVTHNINQQQQQPDSIRYSTSSQVTNEDRKLRDSSDPSVFQYYTEQGHHGQLYNSSKPFSQSSVSKVSTIQDLEKCQKQYQNLHTQPNCFHYIIESNHPQAQAIMNHANYRDKIEISADIRYLQHKILKKPLPNQIYDMGFIFITDIRAFDQDNLRSGYYFVNIDPNFRQIHISKYKNQLKLAHFHNIQLAQKLLLAPFIEHFLFYNKDDTDASKILNLFPTDRFHRSYYSRFTDLSQKIQTHAKVKGRLARIIILCNESNINQIQTISQHHLNLNNFSIYCSLKGSQSDMSHLTKQYPNVTFISDYNFHTYGSVMNYSPSNPMKDSQMWKQSSKINSKLNHTPNNPVQNKAEQNLILMDKKHENTLGHSLTSYLARKYKIIIFHNVSEIKKNANCIVLLHPQGDYIGQQIPIRDYQAVYMVGHPHKRMPLGVVRIDPNDLLQIF